VAQHFLLSKAAKTLSLAQVFRMTDVEAETAFKMVRWPDTNGAPVCPACGSVDAYEARRPNGALRFRCKGCKKDSPSRRERCSPAISCLCGAIWRPLPCSATK
jgi:transposase-like protein